MYLHELERKVWTRYFQDGLWDIWLGLMFLGLGLRSLTDNLWWYLLVGAAILVLILGKHWITLPRLGYIKFSAWRRERQMWLRVIIVAAVLLTAVVVFWGISAGFAYAGWLFVLLVPGVFLLMAYLMDFPRLAFYALLIAGMMVITERYGDPLGAYAALAVGGIALAIGLFYLWRFLRRYPTLDAEQTTYDSA